MLVYKLSSVIDFISSDNKILITDYIIRGLK